MSAIKAKFELIATASNRIIRKSLIFKISRS